MSRTKRGATSVAIWIGVFLLAQVILGVAVAIVSVGVTTIDTTTEATTASLGAALVASFVNHLRARSHRTYPTLRRLP